MAKTIAEGFDEFHSKLTPIKTESELIKSHRESIKKCLESNFGMTNFFRTGSIGNGTSVNGYSDVDYFAVIPTNNLKQNSGTTLLLVKNALTNRFPKTSGIRVDTPAVIIPFGDSKYKSETTEIVPADRIKKENDYYVYDIPDCDDGWRKSSPSAHNNYVTEVNKSLDFRVKPLIRFVKAWKFYRNVPISSFYLELYTTRYASKEETIVYPIDILRVLKAMQNDQLCLMIDPLGIAGYISPCSTQTKKEDALSKLATAVSRAQNAVDAEKDGHTADSFYWWNLFYNEKFPSY